MKIPFIFSPYITPTHHFLREKTPSIEKNIPEVWLQGRDPGARVKQLISEINTVIGEHGQAHNISILGSLYTMI